VRVHISAKWSNLNINVTTNTITPTTSTTPINTITPVATNTLNTTNTSTTRKGREKEESLRGRRKAGESNSQRCCKLRCWCNDVIAILSHHVHKTTERTTDRMSENRISATVHYVHLGEDNKGPGVKAKSTVFGRFCMVTTCLLFTYIWRQVRSPVDWLEPACSRVGPCCSSYDNVLPFASA